MHWNNRKTNRVYTDFHICDIKMITIECILKFKNSVIALDDMGDNFNKDINCYFAVGRLQNVQMVVRCHKPAQLNHTTRMSCDTIHLTTYNGVALFSNFNDIYICKHDFHAIIGELNSNHYNITARMDSDFCYGIIKNNKKEDTFVIIDKNRTVIYDSRVGFLELKALNFKNELSNDEII